MTFEKIIEKVGETPPRTKVSFYQGGEGTDLRAANDFLKALTNKYPIWGFYINMTPNRRNVIISHHPLK